MKFQSSNEGDVSCLSLRPYVFLLQILHMAGVCVCVCVWLFVHEVEFSISALGCCWHSTMPSLNQNCHFIQLLFHDSLVIKHLVWYDFWKYTAAWDCNF